LYMVSELSAIGQVVNALTGLDGLPVMIVQCIITTIYTCWLPPSSRSLAHLAHIYCSSRRIPYILLDR
jgi:hypothetical protein